MSSEVAIRISGLSKSYGITRDRGLRATNLGEAIMQRLRKPFGQSESETFWALKDVDIEIKKGEVVGVIGRNGAGKSTLLKILSRITEPTTGRIELFGRVGSLLEVGTGFHPELSGRENIYLNGAILGMRKSEIRKQFDAIVDFSEVERFLDTPVKRYSSGMYVRLAFAVAAHLNPEILIVDEVLAVGDAEFQKKCMGKMQDVAGDGRTVIFVSHNMTAVESLCTSAILLESGKTVAHASSREVLQKYLYTIHESGEVVSDSRVAQLVKTTGNYIVAGDRTTIEFNSIIDFKECPSKFHLDIAIEDSKGNRLFQCSPTADARYAFKPQLGENHFKTTIHSCGLLPGMYFGTLYAYSDEKGVLSHVKGIPLFSVPMDDRNVAASHPYFRAILAAHYEQEHRMPDPDIDSSSRVRVRSR